MSALPQPARPTTGTLLDEIVPSFDFGSQHAIVVPAPPERVAAAVETHRPGSSALVRLLFRLRGLGVPPGTLRDGLAAAGFTVLAEHPGREVVLGIAGRFWTLDERAHMRPVRDARAFVDFHEPGWAKAAVNLRMEPLSAGATRLSTETRVQCVDGAAYRWFALYWTLIRPFSGWIREDMLRAIRRRAVAP